MPHVGKLYPFLNRGRVISATHGWPGWPATEYTWDFTEFGGLGASLPVAGRGLLPLDWVPGEHTITYEKVIGAVLGNPVVLHLNLSLDFDGLTNHCEWLLIQGTNVCCSAIDPTLLWAEWADIYFDAGQTVAGIGYGIVHPIGGYPPHFQAVPWTATPPPPATSPF